MFCECENKTVSTPGCSHFDARKAGPSLRTLFLVVVETAGEGRGEPKVVKWFGGWRKVGQNKLSLLQPDTPDNCTIDDDENTSTNRCVSKACCLVEGRKSMKSWIIHSSCYNVASFSGA